MEIQNNDDINTDWNIYDVDSNPSICLDRKRTLFFAFFLLQRVLITLIVFSESVKVNELSDELINYMISPEYINHFDKLSNTINAFNVFSDPIRFTFLGFSFSRRELKLQCVALLIGIVFTIVTTLLQNGRPENNS